MALRRIGKFWVCDDCDKRFQIIDQGENLAGPVVLDALRHLSTHGTREIQEAVSAELSQPVNESGAEEKTWTVADFEKLRLGADELQKSQNGKAEVSRVIGIISSADTEILSGLLGGAYRAWKAGRLDKDLYHLMFSALNELGTVPYPDRYALAQLFVSLSSMEESSALNSEDEVEERGNVEQSGSPTEQGLTGEVGDHEFKKPHEITATGGPIREQSILRAEPVEEHHERVETQPESSKYPMMTTKKQPCSICGYGVVENTPEHRAFHAQHRQRTRSLRKDFLRSQNRNRKLLLARVIFVGIIILVSGIALNLPGFFTVGAFIVGGLLLLGAVIIVGILLLLFLLLILGIFNAWGRIFTKLGV